MRALALGILTALGAGVAASAALAEAVTTRIETRPFYGATVTLEEGVRVFRPLPRHDRVIINPGGQTPLSLGYAESNNYSYNQYSGGGGGGPLVQDSGPGFNDSFGTFGRRGHHRHRHHGRSHGFGHVPGSRR